jgi:hypothetical protein
MDPPVRDESGSLYERQRYGNEGQGRWAGVLQTSGAETNACCPRAHDRSTEYTSNWEICRSGVLG